MSLDDAFVRRLREAAVTRRGWQVQKWCGASWQVPECYADEEVAALAGMEAPPFRPGWRCAAVGTWCLTRQQALAWLAEHREAGVATASSGSR